MNWLWMPAFARHHVIEKFFPGPASKLYREMKNHYENAFYHYSRGEMSEGDGFKQKFSDAHFSLKSRVENFAQIKRIEWRKENLPRQQSMFLGLVEPSLAKKWSEIATDARQELDQARGIGLKIKNESNPQKLDELETALVAIDRHGSVSQKSW